jgi:hypothetical protein
MAPDLADDFTVTSNKTADLPKETAFRWWHMPVKCQEQKQYQCTTHRHHEFCWTFVLVRKTTSKEKEDE